MNPVPLHPALVHLPLGLAFVLPVVVAVFTWALWAGRIKTRSWLSVVLLFATLLAAGFVALKTGQNEEERVEATVPEAALSLHEELAEQFLWITGITLVAASAVLFLRRPIALRSAALATLLGSFLVTGSALRVGHAGGKLVYVHHAASAYTAGNVSGTQGKQATSTMNDQPSRFDDDDHKD